MAESLTELSSEEDGSSSEDDDSSLVEVEESLINLHSNTTINQLPNELLLKIFSYFSLRELSSKVSLVCQKWYSLAHDPVLWQHMDFNFTQQCGKTKDILTKVPLLKTLSIVARKDVNEIIDAVAKHCLHLCNLEVAFCSSLLEQSVSVIVNKCENIESLSLKGSHIADATPFCYDQISAFYKLHTLNLSLTKHLQGYHLRLFANTLDRLKDLNIGGITNFTDDDMVYFIDNTKERLTGFRFDASNLTDTTFCALGSLKNLITLSITMAQKMTDKGLASIASLEHIIHLEILFAHNVTDKAFIKMFDSASAKKIEYLDLSWCSHLKDGVVLSISKNCPLLSHLELRYCMGITDTGISAIVKSCKRLTFLDLLGSRQITGSSLTEIPTHLKNLSYLNVRDCLSVDDEILEQIVYQLPSLIVYNRFNEIVY